MTTLRQSWGWLLGLGAALAVLGVIALGSATLMTIASVMVFGWLLIAGGVMEMALSWRRTQWSGFFLHLLTGVLYLVVGLMILASPAATAIALTLLIAMFLAVGGIFRMGAAIAIRFPNWGWVALHGLISLVLGIAIWQQWPLSGLWVIGLFVGIEMLMNGITLMMAGLAARSLPKELSAA